MISTKEQWQRAVAMLQFHARPPLYMRLCALSISALWLVLLSVGGSLSYAQDDPAALREAVKSSVVFVSTEWRDADGRNKGVTTGTGFLVSDQGHVVTAAHVVPAAKDGQQVSYFVALQSRHATRFQVQVIKRDTDLDVALLQLPDVDVRFKPLKFGNSTRVPLEAKLFTLGFPLSADLSSAEGRFSNRSGDHGQWQTTLPLNPGTSGSPVFFEGAVVGMAAGGIDDAQGISFVIPGAFVRHVIDGLVGDSSSEPPRPALQSFTQAVLLCTGKGIEVDSPDAAHPNRHGLCEKVEPYFSASSNTFVARCGGGINPGRSDGLWHQGSTRLPGLPLNARIVSVNPNNPTDLYGYVRAFAEVGPAIPVSTTINVYCRVLNEESASIPLNVEIVYAIMR